MIRAAIIALCASPAMAATVPAFVIEASDCGTVHSLHEDMTSAVVPNERGSRRYVCGDPVNPFPYYAALDIKGGYETPALAAVKSVYRPHPVAYSKAIPKARATSGAHGFGTSSSGSSASASAFSHTHTDTCGCGCCDPVPPAPVPLPASGWMLLAALGLLWRRR